MWNRKYKFPTPSEKFIPPTMHLDAPPVNPDFEVQINGEYGNRNGSIHLIIDGEEVVMWDSAEWVEDPSLVYVIVNAIRKGFEGNLDKGRD